jgi:hypothetical protein
MRVLIEIVLAAAIVALAWEKPLKERTNELPWFGDKAATSQESTKVAKKPQPPPAVTPAAWMWDPNRRSALNTPPPKSEIAPSTPSSSPGSWMFDPHHRSPLDPPSKKHASPTPH